MKVTIFHNVERDSSGRPAGMLDGYQAGHAIVRVFEEEVRDGQDPYEVAGQMFEAFNALNKVNLGTPNRYVNTPQFGTVTMAMTPGREIQLSARVSF